jgi:hypothetical protein
MRFLVESGDKSARPLQRHVDIIDPEKQEQPVSRQRPVRAHQGRMLVCAPLVETKQHGSIRVEELTPIVMSRRRFGLPKERLVPFEAVRNVSDADDCPYALHGVSAAAQTVYEQARPDSLIRAASESNFAL